MIDRPAPTDGGERPGDERLRSHHEWFRRLVRGQVEPRLRCGLIRRSDWVLQCYRSIEVFETRFPDPGEREDTLRLMEERYARIGAEIDGLGHAYPSPLDRRGR